MSGDAPITESLVSNPLNDTIHESGIVRRSGLDTANSSPNSRLIVRQPLASRHSLLSSLIRPEAGSLCRKPCNQAIVDDHKPEANIVYESLRRKTPSLKSFVRSEIEKGRKSVISTDCSKLRKNVMHFRMQGSPMISNQSTTIATKSPRLNTPPGFGLLCRVLLKSASNEHTKPAFNSRTEIPRSCPTSAKNNKIIGKSQSRFREYCRISSNLQIDGPCKNSEPNPSFRGFEPLKSLMPVIDTNLIEVGDDVSMLTPQFNSAIPVEMCNFSGLVSKYQTPSSTVIPSKIATFNAKSVIEELELLGQPAKNIPYDSLRKRTDSFRKFQTNSVTSQKHSLDSPGPYRREVGLLVKTSFGKNNELEVKTQLY